MSAFSGMSSLNKSVNVFTQYRVTVVGCVMMTLLKVIVSSTVVGEC